MPRSHLCQSCGQELAEIAAPPDPHYGLPVVVCPRCGAASVRRPRAGAARWQSALRGWSTCRGVAIRVLLIWALIIVTTTSTAAIDDSLRSCSAGQPLSSLLVSGSRSHARLMSWLDVEGRWSIGGCMLSWIGVGLLAGLAWPHWRVVPWILGWLLGPVVLIAPLVLALAASDWAAGATPLRQAILSSPAVKWTFSSPWFTAAALLPGFLLATALLPTGRRLGVRLGARKGLASRRLKRRRRARRMA